MWELGTELQPSSLLPVASLAPQSGLLAVIHSTPSSLRFQPHSLSLVTESHWSALPSFQLRAIPFHTLSFLAVDSINWRPWSESKSRSTLMSSSARERLPFSIGFPSGTGCLLCCGNLQIGDVGFPCASCGQTAACSFFLSSDCLAAHGGKS